METSTTSTVPTDTPAAEQRPQSFPDSGHRPELGSNDPRAIPVPRSPRSQQASSIGSALLFNLVIPILLLAAGGLVIYALGSVQPATRELPGQSRAARLERLTNVSVEPIYTLESLGADLKLSVDGTVVPFREVMIATEVAGKIIYKSPDCEAGSVVREGAVLMRIDPTDYELEVERLTRQREQAYQAIREIDQEVAGTQRLLKVAKDDLEIQQRELERQKSLPKGYASRSEFDRAQRAVLQANQQIVTLENQRALQTKRRASLEASQRLAETQLKSAEVNLQRTTITAPIGGVIVREDAELNTFVNRGNPIVTMEDTSKVEVAANLRMDQIYWLASQEDLLSSNATLDDKQDGYRLPETPATINFQVGGARGTVYRWQGRLVGYDGIGVDGDTRTAPVRILVDQPRKYTDEHGEPHETSGPTALVRGMFVNVDLTLRPKVRLYAVPEKAIKPGNRLWQFVKDDSVLEASPSEGESSISPDKSGADTKAANGFSEEDQEVTAPDTESDFDADAWVPGRVGIVQPIIAVDRLDPKFYPKRALHSGGEAIIGESSFDDDDSSATNWWICELPEDFVEPEWEAGDAKSYVVVSPLGNIPREGLAARVRTTDLVTEDTTTAANDREVTVR